MMRLSVLRPRSFAPALLAALLSLVYWRTLAPGLTWANDGADGGDLVTAAVVGGVPHPTGYPLYLLAARLFQFIPAGDPAFRANLLSAAAGVTAGLLVYAIVIRSLPARQDAPDWPAALLAGLAFGLSPLFWSQAVIAEVYSLQACLTALLLLLSIEREGGRPSTPALDRLSGLVFGLALCNHVTSALLLPVLLLPALPSRGSRGLDGPSLLRRAAWTLAGLLPYLILPLRAVGQPPVNWGDPHTLRGLAWLVMGGPYHARYLSVTAAEAWLRFRSAAGLLIDQFGLAGLFVGMTGVLLFKGSSTLRRSLLWTALAGTLFSAVYGTPDSFVYLLPVFLCFAIWVGWGAGALADLLPTRASLLPVLVLSAFLAFQTFQRWPAVDASQDDRALIFATQALDQAPQNAMIFARGDRALFSLWYFHFALQRRPDLAVIATDLLQYDWYQASLHAAYPDLRLPETVAFPEVLMADNPARPYCLVQYQDTARIECLPPAGP